MEEIRQRAHVYLVGAGELFTNFVRHLFRQSHSPGDYKSSISLHGKVATSQTCVITGGNAGIGFATAAAMLKRGCNVVLACRNLEKADEAVKQLEQMQVASKNQHRGRLEVMEVSLSSLASVRSFCKAFNARNEPLHFLILNAGVFSEDSTRRVTEDGLEEHFQVNHLSQWLIACKLIQEQRKRRREKSPGASDSMRVIFMSSMVHMGGAVKLTDLQLKSGPYSAFRGYSASKLENVLTARRMNTMISRDGSGDASVSVHPGMIDTGLAHGWMEGSDIFGVLQVVTARFLRAISPLILESSQTAAQTVLFAALAPAALVGGKYCAQMKVVPSAKEGSDDVLAAGLWKASMALVQDDSLEEL